MQRLKSAFWIVAGMLVLVALAGNFASETIAQVRAALVRDVDNGALNPQRIAVFGSLAANETYKSFLGPTVPADKRLVIENASVWTFSTGTDRITAVWLKPVNVAQYVLLDPAESEFRNIAAGGVIAAYNRVVKAYFNPNEQVQVEVYADGTTAQKLANVYLQGYYVNLP